MGSVIGIPTTRVSDLFLRQRLLNQVRSDQLDLFRIQMQLSTGRRLFVPSEDASAALRVMSLQRLLEQKEQVKTNLATSQYYLAESDSALSGISSSIAEVRGVALGVLDTVSTDTQREAAAQQVAHTIQQLLSAGNQKFRGRYLFGGCAAAGEPFQLTDQSCVKYIGNEGRLSSYADIGLLFDTNLHGGEVFGALSEAVQGTADLDPILTFNTRLADLHGGLGIARGSIAISDGSSTSIIDLSGAETIGDVAAMIRANPPEGKTLQVEITHTGLIVELEGLPGDLLSIKEVAGGSTAEELGILRESGLSSPILGEDLDPLLRGTTRLSDVLGTRSYVVVRFEQSNNDLIFSAHENGTELNDTEIVFNAVAGGPISFSHDAVGKRLTVNFDPDGTTAHDIIDALAADPLGALFSVSLDPLDGGPNSGAGKVQATDPLDPPKMAAGSDTILDLDAGLQIVNGGETHTIDLSGAETIEDLLSALNAAATGLLAEINAEGTGINIRSRVSGADFMIGENGGRTATQLGVRTFTEKTRLDDLDYGEGVSTYDGTDFTITRSDGVTIDVDVSGCETIGEVLDLINSLGGGVLEARLATYGNGIELCEAAPGLGTLTVTRSAMSSAAIGLGLIPEGQQSNTAALVGGSQTLTGADVNPLETEGIFTALLRLQVAIQANDVPEAQRAIGMLDEQTVALNFARAELGARQQGLDVIQARLEEENIDLQEALSADFDTDLVEVISQLTARQIAYEASLKTTAAILGLSLLDYL
jgi:flagellar hook-associated protein 3 FlgL